MPALTPASVAGGDIVPGEGGGMSGGKRTRGATAKQLKRMLKKAGLKTTGRKAALTRRAKKAHLKMRGGAPGGPVVEEDGVKIPTEGASRRRKGGNYKLF